MTPPHAREIAAADLIGRRLSGRRQRAVLVEFAAAVVVGLGVAAFTLGRGGGLAWIVGVASLGFAVNYEVLLAHSIALLRRMDVLERLASSPDWPETLRRVTRRQLWLLVPFSLVGHGRWRTGSIS